jgi:hypothetical protein
MPTPDATPHPGDRVVVRYLLDDGRATDVIGTLVSDGDPLVDPLVIDADTGRAAGERRTVPRSAVVAMKAVPPRPVRGRAAGGGDAPGGG